MMYNDVDNDLPPFNDTIDGEEIFLFSNTKTSSTGASFLHEDDDDHLRHQHNVVAGTSSHHIPVDVDELLLNSNFLEQPNCDQSEDPLFWNCKDISDDQLNEFLPTTHLHLNSNNLSNNHHCVNPNTIATTTNFANNGSSNNTNTQQHGIVISQQQQQTQNITHIQHSQTIIPIQSNHQLQHHTIAPLLSQSQLINHQHQIHQIRLQQPDPTTQQQTNTSVSDQSQQQQPSQVLVQQGFQAPQQIIQHVDQYQSKWITLVQTNESYQNFNPQPPQQQHQQAQIFFDKLPQTLVQTDIGSSIIQNPVSSVITTTSPQITIQQQPPAQSQHQVQTTQQQVKSPPQQQSVQQQQSQAHTQQLLSTVVQTQQTQLSSQSGVSTQEPSVTKTVSPNIENGPKKEASTTKLNKPKEKQTRLDCPYCKRSFSKNFDLQQHMRCHTGEKPFQCIVCGRGFAQKSNVKKHMQAHKVWPEGPNNPPMPLNHSSARSRNNSASSSRDDECMQENDALQLNDNNNNLTNGTATTLGLSNDRKNEGNDIFAENRYSCSYCPFNGRTYFELKSHLTVHKREKVFKCIVSSCGKTFSGADLQGFLDHVTGHKDLIYHCHLCSGQFYSLDEFGEHQKHHSNAQMKRTTQSQLPPSNQTQATLSNRNSNTSLRQQNQQVTTPTQLQPQQNQRQYNQQHAAPTHQQQQVSSSNQKNVKIFNSSNNSTTVSNNSNNNNNSSSRSKNNNQKYFRCSKCMNRYTTQTALDHHLSISTHNFPCTECNKVFMCERYLRRHLNTHTAVQHVCTFCDKHFKTAAYLKMHSVVHTGEKPFRCNQCEAAFNRRDKLNRHKLTHETIKKFKCPFRPHVGCTKEFNRPDKLKAHVLTHSGVRPHPCDSCSRTFSRLSRLREHRRLQHDNNNITSNSTGINNDNNVTTSRQQVNLQTSETLKTEQQQPQQQFEKNVSQIVVGFDSMSCVNVNSDIVVGITGGSV